MSEIIVNVGMLEQSIMQLTRLVSTCNNSKKNVNIQGGGATISEMENIVKLYSDMYDELVQLIGNTSIFMKNIKTSYEINDRKAAGQIASGM